MDKVNDITSLEEYQAYREAHKNSRDYGRKVDQMQRKIDKKYQAYKSKLEEAENADSLKDEQEAKEQAEELKVEAQELQKNLDEFQEKSPHYGNLRGAAMNELKAKGRPFIKDLEEKAIQKIREAREVLSAIHESKQKLPTDEVKFIPKVTHQLEKLKEIENTI